MFVDVAWLTCGIGTGWQITCCGYSTEIEFQRDETSPLTLGVWRNLAGTTQYDLVAVTTESSTNDGSMV